MIKELKQFKTSYYLLSKLDPDIVKKLKEYCWEIKNHPLKKSHNDKLAGNLKEEYTLPTFVEEFLHPHISELATEISDNSRDEFSKQVAIWKHQSLWVNFQQKYEFNPLHNHSGMYSYVLWLNIPYDLEKEMNLDFVKNSNTPSATAFSLVYTDASGLIVHEDFLPEKEDEGTILMFASRMSHLVYPFYTSDDYRISISGNIIPEQLKDSRKRVILL